jgi:hypothetical protein
VAEEPPRVGATVVELVLMAHGVLVVV